ncbi:MAG: hypothetical protein IJZ02_04625 [Clostridia bacterium]|nr:hypothetical protein [Clostridia bacterium]
MSTSDIKGVRPRAAVIARRYLYAAAFSLLLGVVYTCFSNGVYSAHMLLAFVFPLMGGAAVFGVLSRLGERAYPAQWAERFYRWGIAALTLGSHVHGALEIYGTENTMTAWYWWIGGLLAEIGVAIYAVRMLTRRGD